MELISEGMDKYILALDQGTTSCRAILFDSEGTILSVAQKELRQFFPKEGWVEHDPEEIVTSQVLVAREAIAAIGVVASDVEAVGIANQRETTIVWERQTGKPIYPAIGWQDRRTISFVKELSKAGYYGLLKERTGLVPNTYFSASKLSWILDNVPGVRARAITGDLLFGTIDSWLAFRLSRGVLHVTDASNASRTMLYDIHNGRWDPDILDMLDIPAVMLPEVRDSSVVLGELTELLEHPVLLAGMIGDQQAACVGQALFEPGLAKNTYGTGCFLLAYTGQHAMKSNNKLLTTVALQSEGRKEYALEGSVFIGGAVVQWLRDGLGVIKKAADIETLANSVPNTGGVYLVPAFAGLGAPYWDQNARGIITGLTRGSTARHLARAALEAIAYQVVDVVRAMENDIGRTLSEIRVDGGAAANNLLMQIQADLLGFPVVRSRKIETTAWGAALLAGLAVGFWRDRSVVSKLWEVDRKFVPNISLRKREQMISGWEEAIARTRSDQ